jgi:methyl-accepting chemotaxis protein
VTHENIIATLGYRWLSENSSKKLLMVAQGRFAAGSGIEVLQVKIRTTLYAGFAIVAGEVKGLANQTTSATEEVETQIGGIQGEIENAVAAISRISETIDAVDETSQVIADSVEFQRTATDEISRNAQQAADDTQAVSNAIHQMSSETGTTATLYSSARTTAGEVAQQVADMQTELTKKLRQNYG